MARSTYVYIVRDPDGRILGAFTVKHELRSWLTRQEDRIWYMITRHQDANPDAGGTLMTTGEIPA